MAAAALVLSGTASVALAQQAKARLTDSAADRGVAAPDRTQWTGETKRKTVEWDEGHWGVRLDVDRPAPREPRPSDVTAGAYYRITPSLQVGGAVSLTQKAPDAQKPAPSDRRAPTASAGIALKF